MIFQKTAILITKMYLKAVWYDSVDWFCLKDSIFGSPEHGNETFKFREI
jgi:hypothetical protein